MKFIVIIVSAISFVSLMAVEIEEKNQSSQLQSIVVGSVSGMTEVLVDQPLITIKNYLIEKRTNPNAKVPCTIKDFYRGFNANMLGMVPTTAMQMVAYDKVNSLVKHEEDSLYKSWAPVVAGGFAGAIPASPIELVIIRQNKDQIPLFKALKCIVQEEGVSKLVGRGFVATAIRDTGFTKGMLEGHPWAKEQLITAIPSMPATAASLISGASVGAVVAVVTHPVDTIKYKQQSFAARTIWDACRLTYQQGGAIAFWDGVSARGVRIAFATIVMSETRETLNNLINKS